MVARCVVVVVRCVVVVVRCVDMSEEIKDIMDALENNELKNDGFWGRACSRLSQQLQTAKEENEKLMEQLNTKYLEWEETFMENQNLTRQNKQLDAATQRQNIAKDKKDRGYRDW